MGHCTTELPSDLQENQRHWALLKFEVLEMRGSTPATQNRKKKEQSKPGLWLFAHHRISVCSSAYIKKLQVCILNCVQGKQLETVSIKLWSTILFSNDMNLKKKKRYLRAKMAQEWSDSISPVKLAVVILVYKKEHGLCLSRGWTFIVMASWLLSHVLCCPVVTN